MNLTGERVTLRAWKPSDAASLAKHANNAKVAQHLRDRFPHPYTIADARQFIQSVAGARPTMLFAMVVDGGPAGGIGFFPGADVERFSAELGYWLAEPYWGRGITVEAVRLISKYAFEDCNLLRLFALPFADNAQSIRVLEKAGYTREGTLRASSVKYGRVRDQALFALVNEGWKGV
jgi:RimJ/RimL family protein N-acetyltransferase